MRCVKVTDPPRLEANGCRADGVVRLRHRVIDRDGAVHVFEDQPLVAHLLVRIRAIEGGSPRSAPLEEPAIDLRLVRHSTAVAVSVMTLTSRVLAEQTVIAPTIGAARHDL